MPETNFFTAERQRMVDEQLIPRHIRDPRLLDAMRTVPRHLFVPPKVRHLAYADGPLPIGQSQTISQPYIVAYMTELLDLQGDEKVLEIGTGSGYQAAILAELAREVYTIEQHPPLARRAARTLELLGYRNVHVLTGDGSRGLPEHAPYDAIIVTAAAPHIPQTLLDQLADGGRLVAPVGGEQGQILQRWQREGQSFLAENLAPVAFVPLRGQFGWQTKEWS